VADPGARLLQVIDAPVEGAGPCLLRLVRDAGAAACRTGTTLIIGSSRDAARARCAGLAGVQLLPRIRRHGGFAARSLGRWIDRRERQAGRFDMVRVWTDMAGVGALRSGLAQPVSYVALSPVVPCADPEAGAGDPRGQRMTIAAWCVRADDGAGGAGTGAIRSVTPGVQREDHDNRRRMSVRGTWGVGPDVVVVGLLAEPMCRADAWTAMEAVFRYAATNRPVRLVLSGQASRRDEVERALRWLSRDDLLIVDDAVCRPWEVACGLDAALCLGGGDQASPLPALWAMAGGAPVIADDRPALRSVMSLLCPEALVPPDDHGAACRLLTRWAHEQAGRRELGMALRCAVAESFAMAPLVEALNADERALSGDRATRA